MQQCQSALRLVRRTVAYKYIPLLPYHDGLTLQDITVASKLRWRDASSSSTTSHTSSATTKNIDVLYLLQHSPVYTAGRRVRNSYGTDGTRLKKLGADYVEVQRGGQVTFHGPGQLVGYPILDLKAWGLSVRCYVEALQSFIIHLCQSTYNIPASTTEHTGVWVQDRKIAALGLIYLISWFSSYSLPLSIAILRAMQNSLGSFSPDAYVAGWQGSMFHATLRPMALRSTATQI